jgi:hypothetical protein
MDKKYFIDSENVGDNWIFLLDTVAVSDEIFVFYTAKSPHMNYKNLITLKESPKDVTFIECCEGNNALDFQLCTELGYQVHGSADNEYIIVTNDTGYDAVVKYWKERDIAIKRMAGKACIQKQQSTSKKDLPTSVVIEDAKPAPSKNPNDGIPKEAKEIFYILGRDQLQPLHESLQQIYGKQGGNYYNSFKSDATYSNYIANHKKKSLEEKQKSYCQIVFAHAKNKVAMPADFPEFVTETWNKKKNLNSFRASLQTKYGKEASEKYYSLIKAHIKILDKIK